MALINITPIMTSNTTPSPYVVSSNNNWEGYEAWKAFNNTLVNSGDTYLTQSGTTTSWLKIDFSTTTKVDAFSLYYRNNTTYNEVPKTFILYGSNDDSSYEQIIKVDSQSLWATAEGRLYKFPFSVSFRYYKLNILENNGNLVATAVGLLKFWKDDTVVEYVTNKKASMQITMPQAPTSKIKLIENNPKEALLISSNDAANYGTLYMINNEGRAIIPMAAMTNEDVLFNGVADIIDIDYTIAKSYKYYKYIAITVGVTTDTAENGSCQTLIVPTNLIILNNIGQFALSVFFTTSYSWSMTLHFTSDIIFRINSKNVVGWANPVLRRITGIK